MSRKNVPRESHLLLRMCVRLTQTAQVKLVIGRVRPLKMVVDEVKKQETTNKPIKINVDIMLDILKSNQVRAFDV